MIDIATSPVRPPTTPTPTFWNGPRTWNIVKYLKTFQDSLVATPLRCVVVLHCIVAFLTGYPVANFQSALLTLPSDLGLGSCQQQMLSSCLWLPPLPRLALSQKSGELVLKGVKVNFPDFHGQGDANSWITPYQNTLFGPSSYS